MRSATTADGRVSAPATRRAFGPGSPKCATTTASELPATVALDERAAILTLFDGWAEVDRSHRKLAARGSRLRLVHASAATVRRVLAAEGLVLKGKPPREPQVRAPWPDWVVWKPGSIWCYDFQHFNRARRSPSR